jgi:hypothetical protein
MAACLTWGVRVKPDRRPRFPIKSLKQLAVAMDGGRRLVQTNGPGGPGFTVDGRNVDPAVVDGCRRNGWLRQCDRGLFDDTPLSWTMEAHHGEY